MDQVPCKCGCGALARLVDSRGRERSGYVHGHNRRGQSNWWLRKPDREITEFATRARARRITPPGPCELARIGGCAPSGRTDVHHLDGDPWNNELRNLMRLCRTHHYFVERGIIDLANPVMPQFKEFANGNRVYVY